MSKKIKFGIIGCSNIAERSVIPAIIESKNAEVVTIGSRSIEKAKNFASKFDCTKFGTYDDVINDVEVDAVYISLPIALHQEWCKKAAIVKKHIICEKSFSDSLESTMKVLDICKANNIRIMEGFMVRFHPRTKKILEIIKEKTIGNVFSFLGNYGFPHTSFEDIRYNRNLGGGVLNETGCYPVIMCRTIFDEEPVGVFSNLYFDKKLDVDTKGAIIMLFQNSKIGQMTFSFDSSYQANYRIWGDKGILETERAYSIPPTLESKITIQNTDNKEVISIDAANQFKLMIEEFSKEILEEHNDRKKFEDEILKQAKVMEAIRISNKENRFVFINEVDNL